MNTAANKPQTGFTGVDRMVLKLTATLFMLIDHVATLFAQMGIFREFVPGMHIIGRLAFPIFCFLLVEGYMHTRNVKKYLLRLAVFAALSEVPFDLFMYNKAFYPAYNNVGLTLLMGLLLIWIYDETQRRGQFVVGTTAAVMIILTAGLLRCDYGAEGVLMIYIFFLLRGRPFLRLLMVGLVMILIGGIEIYGILAMLLIVMYNGQNGKIANAKLGYLFYAFYPLHLLILYLIRVFA